MIIFLYGEDTYRARQKLNEIIAHYRRIHQSGLNLKYFNCSEKESFREIYPALRNEVRQTSMFQEKKLVVITNSFSNSEFKEYFLKEAENFLESEDIILFYESGKPDERNSLFRFLKKKTKCQEFKPLLGQKLREWVKKEFEKYKTEIEPMALEKLIDYVGNDLWRMSNEIEKLVTFKARRQISSVDVEALVRARIETDIFRTIDAISERNKKKALELLHKHLEKGDNPLYLLSMINYQFRNLLIVKELVEKHKPYNIILKESGLRPFVLKKSCWQSRQFSLGELKKIYQKIFKVDLEVKTGKIEPEIALDLLLEEI